MKRYLLFIYTPNYANGGWNDYIGDFNTVEEAKAGAYEEFKHRIQVVFHVVDTHVGISILQGSSTTGGSFWEEERVDGKWRRWVDGR